MRDLNRPFVLWTRRIPSAEMFPQCSIKKNKGLQLKWSYPSRYGLDRVEEPKLKDWFTFFTVNLKTKLPTASVYRSTHVAAALVPPDYTHSKEIPS